MKLCATDFRATYLVQKPFQLPYHSGSLIRGVLGRALRLTGCGAAGGTCVAECARVPGCTYARLFDPSPPDPPPHRFLRGVVRPPQPLVPIIPRPGQIDLRAGAPFELGVRVLGPLIERDGARLTAALEELAAQDLGERGGSITFQSVTQLGPRDRLLAQEVGATPAQRIGIVFETPAWLEQKGRLVIDLDFRGFFRSIHRRLTTLCALYGELAPDEDAEFARLDAHAAAIRTASLRLRPLKWERLSEERGERHPMRGLLGTMAFEGELGRFLPALRLAEVTHIGKGTSFGLGRIKVTDKSEQASATTT